MWSAKQIGRRFRSRGVVHFLTLQRNPWTFTRTDIYAALVFLIAVGLVDVGISEFLKNTGVRDRPKLMGMGTFGILYFFTASWALGIFLATKRRLTQVRLVGTTPLSVGRVSWYRGTIFYTILFLLAISSIIVQSFGKATVGLTFLLIVALFLFVTICFVPILVAPLRARRAPWMLLWIFAIGAQTFAFALTLYYKPVFRHFEQYASTHGLPIEFQGNGEFFRPKASGTVERAEVTRLRATCTQNDRWQSAHGPIRIAVTLSGGGYRAAVTHAGVLAAMDEACIPITYLSTVSGGSIVGAYYALGNRPLDFLNVLKAGGPGPADDSMSFLMSFLAPFASSADLYADDFDDEFFGGAKLQDLPDLPVLLVNAIDVEARPDAAREVFSKSIAERLSFKGNTLARSIRVADVVAASGAFPGAFDPKSVPWQAAYDPLSTGAVAKRRFIDGGVVENLGVTGLIRYLKSMPDGVTRPPKPDLLIVIDASHHESATELPPKPSPVAVWVRMNEIEFEEVHRYLWQKITGQQSIWTWINEANPDPKIFSVKYDGVDLSLAGREPEILRTIVIPTTAPELQAFLRRNSHRDFQGRTVEEVQDTVRRFSTLKQLNPSEIDDAFFLGKAVGESYIHVIECARRQMKSEDLRGCRP
jgi:predicted acylesterase/phospholipase RssA